MSSAGEAHAIRSCLPPMPRFCVDFVQSPAIPAEWTGVHSRHALKPQAELNVALSAFLPYQCPPLLH